MRWLLLVLVTGCTVDLSCPAETHALGTFALTYSAVDAGDNCVVDASLDAGSVLTSTPSSTAVAFCEASDGGQIYARFYGEGTRAVTLDGGVFTIAESASDVTGSLCTCALNIAETFTGTLAVDGGTATSFSASVDEEFSAASSGCTCNVPCGVHYSVSAAQ